MPTSAYGYILGVSASILGAFALTGCAAQSNESSESGEPVGEAKAAILEAACLTDTADKTDQVCDPGDVVCANIVTLQRLDLRGNWIEDRALDTLLGLPNLTTLNIAHTRITAVGAQRLVREAPPSLRDLTLTVPALADALVAELRARFTLHRWR